MSNAIASSLPNIERTVRANDNIRKTEEPHREHRRKLEEQARKQAIEKAIADKQEMEEVKDDLILDDLYPQVNEIVVTKGATFVNRGYSTVFRGVAHVLPQSYKFTVRGAKLIHRALALIPATALLMQEDWAEVARVDLIEIARHEEERISQRENENAEVIASLRNEIISLIENHVQYTRTDNNEQQLLVKSYRSLTRHLMGLVNEHTRIRGVRVMKLVHEAIIAQVRWALPHWEPMMAADLKRAEEREIEFLAQKRSGKFQKKTFGNKKVTAESDKMNKAVRNLSEDEERQEEERAHEYVREVLEQTDPQNQFEGVNVEVAQAMADFMMEVNDDMIAQLEPPTEFEAERNARLGAFVVETEGAVGIFGASDDNVVEDAKLDDDVEEEEEPSGSVLMSSEERCGDFVPFDQSVCLNPPVEVTETAEGAIGCADTATQNETPEA